MGLNHCVDLILILNFKAGITEIAVIDTGLVRTFPDHFVYDRIYRLIRLIGRIEVTFLGIRLRSFRKHQNFGHTNHTLSKLNDFVGCIGLDIIAVLFGEGKQFILRDSCLGKVYIIISVK